MFGSLTSLTLLHPWWLAIALLVPIALWIRSRRGEPVVRFAPAAFVTDLPRSWRVRLLPVPRVLQIAGLLLAILALARPAQRIAVPIRTEGIDIVLCLDTSSSMSAKDLDATRSRLDVAKAAAARFIAARPDDRIALVCFARYPDLRSPFTRDHEALTKILADVAMVRADGPEDATGIGTAVALGAKALRASRARSKVVVLLTDGEENVATAQTPAEIAPVHAAQLCKELGIRIYAIAAGDPTASSDGRLSVDKSQVRKMAERCEGAYFEARDAAALARVYAEIDALEKAPIEATRFEIEERFLPVLIGALALLVLGGVLRSTVFEVLP